MYDFDARCFYDPNRCRHVGWHPEIINGIVSKNNFSPWLNGVRSKISFALREDVVVPVFLFYCNKGRHRSVATATVVGHILIEEGVQVWRVHLAQSSWFRGACRGVRCSECNGARRSRCGGGERGRGRGSESQRGCAE